ncbi:cellulose biosynthesis cyclic di-GMP-binding regulatory protein BcsB [Rhizobium sp. Leaf341]|uniref:cellulose biosynthesis cyclic di-GMP-binding regulatory protein BcsB n=1 Tax=Rhizobium sp. Leaf341 TaxID=1736344 RepID=UPI000713E9B3|nr:cellulose biosynthesis cyclic di-GMP-binding regulatory protein BcsB [Rhizobium sp. Leaf341]KQR72902.1 cellulose synthase BcsB subunit [Rhizobium sp. Leaf341]
MKHVVIACTLALLAPSQLLAQSAPFDMSRERPAAPQHPTQAPDPAAPGTQTAPSARGSEARPQQPASEPAPFQLSPPVPAPASAEPRPQAPASPAPVQPSATPSAPQSPAAAKAPAPAPMETDAYRRYILPFGKLSLSGETDRRTWTIYLTPEQANAATAITIGYQNSIVVAPEASSFSVELNGSVVGQVPVASADAVHDLVLPLPSGALQAGANVVRLSTQQRHRTDCSIQSTYDLWTNIDPSRTYLTFNAPVGDRLSSIDDIQAVGLDGTGATAIDIVAPALTNPSRSNMLLRLAQALALRTQMPNQTVAFHTALPATSAAGTLTVLVGTQLEIDGMLPTLPAGTAVGPTVAFAPSATRGVNALVVTGPTAEALRQAVETLASPLDAAPGTSRTSFSTKAWHTPDAPILVGDTRIPLSQLGITTSEFAGRRFRTEFMLGVPADFYASAYGDAVILLDAGYAPSVLPGSRIDVYVNGNIATTTPLSTEGGGILSHLPITVTLRHFVPGVNRISIEAVLLAAEDDACATGTPAQTTPRFALFDTTEFHMPDFARIDSSPSLAATSSTGQPYRRAEQPTALYLDRLDPETLSAAATLLGRLAVAAGNPLALDTVASPAALGDRNALIVGTLSQLPPPLLTQMQIGAAPANWGTHHAGGQPDDSSGTLFEEWRQKVSGGSWLGQGSRLEAWLKSDLDLSMDSLRFLPGKEEDFSPSENVSFMIAQGRSPSGAGTWTLATGPTSASLQTGMSAMVQEARWNGLDGRITTFEESTGNVSMVPVRDLHLNPTQPFSIANWRLIAANWLSTNILFFAVIFISGFALLGIITTLMLRLLGRSR